MAATRQAGVGLAICKLLALRAALDPATAVWVVVGDAKIVRPQLDTLGLPVEVVAAASVADAK